MDKVEHGRALAAAIARERLSRDTVADLVERTPRTITNWTKGKSMPSLAEREILRKSLGPYDSEGDPVEVAIKASELHMHRQLEVLQTYHRNLYEQRAEQVG